MRVQANEAMMKLEEGHSDMVKVVKLNSDGMVCLSAGADKSLRLWDIGERRCFRVFKTERGGKEFHTDSIWCLDICSNF